MVVAVLGVEAANLRRCGARRHFKKIRLHVFPLFLQLQRAPGSLQFFVLPMRASLLERRLTQFYVRSLFFNHVPFAPTASLAALSLLSAFVLTVRLGVVLFCLIPLHSICLIT